MANTPDPQIMKAVEQLNYRVTVGDVASQAGLDINLAQQGLLVLAENTAGHLQVSNEGEMIYDFPTNFRSILFYKYWQLRLQALWDKIAGGLFYLLRISFGIMLIVSIVLMLIAITIIVIAISSRDDNGGGNRRRGGGGFNLMTWFIMDDLFALFRPRYYHEGYHHHGPKRSRSQANQSEASDLNFLTAVFSFLFGDGDPNFNLEELRWQTIGQFIRSEKGAVIAEQIAPYLDAIPRDDEDYMIPVLSRFNGYPEVSPQGELVYYFPDLQVTTAQVKPKAKSPSFLQEKLWQFSRASSGQIMGAIGLGSLNFVLALVLGSLLQDQEMISQLGDFIAFMNQIYVLLLGYGVAFLTVPLVRYFWVQQKNNTIKQRNDRRAQLAQSFEVQRPALQPKLTFAQQFAQQKVLGTEDLAYTTEQDLLDQDLANADSIDQEWRDRLGGSS